MSSGSKRWKRTLPVYEIKDLSLLGKEPRYVLYVCFLVCFINFVCVFFFIFIFFSVLYLFANEMQKSKKKDKKYNKYKM